jgi:hypothetical protein
VGWWVGAGSAWRRHAPTPRNSGQPASWPAAGNGLTSLPGSARWPHGRVGSASCGCVRGWWVGRGGRDGPGRPGGRRSGCGGSGGVLGQQPAALSGIQQPLVDLAGVEGADRDQVVEVVGRLPQLAVAVADRGGGDPGQLLGQGRPPIATTGAVGDGWELDGPVGRWRWQGWSRSSSTAGTRPGGVSRSRPRATGVAGRWRGGWVGRPHSHPGPASPHGPARPGWRSRGRWGPDRNASRRRSGPAAPNSANHGRRPAPGWRTRLLVRRCPGRRSGGRWPGRCWPEGGGSTRPAPEPDWWSRP